MRGRFTGLMAIGILAVSAAARSEESLARIRISGPLSLVPPGTACRVELRPTAFQYQGGTCETTQWYEGSLQNLKQGSLQLTGAVYEASSRWSGWQTKTPYLERLFRNTGIPATPVEGGSVALEAKTIKTVEIADKAQAAGAPERSDFETRALIVAPASLLPAKVRCYVHLAGETSTVSGWTTRTTGNGYEGIIDRATETTIVLREARKFQRVTTRSLFSSLPGIGRYFRNGGGYGYTEQPPESVTVPIDSVASVDVVPLPE